MAGEHAQLTLRRMGGLANVPMQATLDTRELGPDEAREITGALDSVDLDRIGERESWPPGAADTFQYTLEVSGGEQQRKVTFSDRQMPPELAPVVRKLMDRAHPAPR